METTQLDLANVIEESLKKSLSYQDYRTLLSRLVEENATTGTNQSEALINYTALNDRRMKRWDKTVKISDEDIDAIKNATVNQTWIVLTESWCGDAAHVIPVINKVAELNTGINLQLVMRDENEQLMDLFLTNGGKSIPKLIQFDNTSKTVLNSYGPRPTEATKLVNDFKKKHGTLTAEFKEDLQRWYNKDKGQNVINDLLELIN
ncbi:thiol-disulfide isomerase/thioredoxin [Mesoflavibacter sabulilitoris]|uniref:Thioredoxin family protein n=1 Tax=Mesoflavibacter zeaxanthinifaciens subsp. sabulilitoris TaxID=1520893 RepID=A0A2T1N769_9FLAO|nr:thioredoxin family protein [Mesoflavibacter zeaxanthinifaciens]MBB3124123.1 thiol-disulfide isomerase/thioredoxin [Mesoflavibacter zeaxanthinifaciens subsp. sabulilitoris]PSG87714.1 thioredoxin family protein [Mesoflavibacter zeaxanthinifaciens subsp. sabulilitoris]